MGKEAQRLSKVRWFQMVVQGDSGRGDRSKQRYRLCDCTPIAQEGIMVVITACDATRGKEALESLKSQGLHNVNFHPLDVASQESILTLAEWLHETYGGIDILINNAGIVTSEKDPTLESVKPVLDTNYFGVMNVTKPLIPLLRDNTPGGALDIVMASTLGQLKNLAREDYVESLSNREQLTEEFVDSFANHYLKDVANGSQKEGGWPSWVNLQFGRRLESYIVSKVAVIAYVSALDTTLVAQPGSEKKISIFSCCPGFVATDLNNHRGKKTDEEGADTPVWLALHSPEGGSGKFWADRKVVDF